jgi:hypothetical protein
MKRFVVLLVMSALCVGMVTAQEEPIPPKRSRAVKVGLFGGFTPSWLKVDVAPVNAFLAGSGITPFEDNGMLLWGGGGAAYIMLVPNLRVGGLGMSGSKSTSGISGNVRRDAQMQVGFGGVTIEYVFPIGERFDVAVGTMLGAGGIDIVLRQDTGGLNTWEGEKALFAGWPAQQPNAMTRTLSGTFFVYIPSVNFEYAILGWCAVRVGASYTGMAAPSWKIDGKYDLNGVPSGVSGKGFMINAGILLGTF